MKIGIIGGGAAGLVAAYYLSKTHDVTLLEKQPIVGGHVRTLGLNVPAPEAIGSTRLDGGVVEFLANNSPLLKALLDELNVSYKSLKGGSSSFFRTSGVAYHMPAAVGRMSTIRDKIPRYLRMLSQLGYCLAIIARAQRMDPETCFDEVFGYSPIAMWIRGLMMYCYSIPYQSIDDVSAIQAYQTLKQIIWDRDWVYVEGGTFAYMRAILEQSDIDVVTGCELIEVKRRDESVFVESSKGNYRFDQLVIATPPYEVLPMLKDADAAEQRCFTDWRSHNAHMVFHTDTSLFDDYSPPEMTEFDIFEKVPGRDAGYNVYLNRLAGLPTTEAPHYFVAYNLEDRIDPEKVVAKLAHQTTVYEAKSDRRDAIRSLSGYRQVFYAGAYLRNGMHESAIRSALEVVKQINE